MKKTLYCLISILSASVVCAAQGPRGPRVPDGAVSSLNLAKLQTVTGAVSSVNLDYGAEYPSITVGQTQIKIAPIWYLLDKDFEIRSGDAVEVLAAPSLATSNPYLYALEITNTATKAHIVLRNASGVPLWTAGGNSEAPRSLGLCLDPSKIATLAGTVEKINAGLGIQMPVLTVKAADGKLYSFKLGPERVLLAADFELKVGDLVTVKYAPAACTEELVALAITNADGVTLVLRNDDGTPAWT